MDAKLHDEEYPRVSVITAAYNRADLIEETIESVLAQDYPNLEYIVLDDGSSDETLAVIKKYDGRIRWDAHPNMGETRTVNRGFSMATGEIIGVVSSDDPLLSGAVRKLAARLASDTELLVAYPDWVEIDEHGETIRHQKTWDYSYIEMLRKHHCVPGPGTFFRRSVLERLGGRNPQFRYVADLDFWFRAGLLGKFARLPETLATFRVHPDSASVKSKGAEMAAEHIRLMKEFYSLPNLPPEVLEVKQEALSSAYRVAADQCSPEMLWSMRKYYARAIFHAPRKFLAGEYREHFDYTRARFLGSFLNRVLHSLEYRLGKSNAML